jgi:hypothetical protein
MTPVFACTAALSAFLLFLVQPLIAKPILPLLGGSPSVWNTCMVTFQLLLLLGYCYAYASSRFLTVRRQSLLHLALFGVSLLLLPLGLHAASFEAHDHPQLWLVVTLLLSVGGCYFMLSSSAPMLQGWVAKTSHSLAKNPYPLYAASNAGSFFGLLAYPLLIEPRFSTPQQFSILSIGYLSLVLGFLYCAIVIRGHRQSPAENAPATPEARPDKTLLFCWLSYSAIPASLLFGTTTFILTDIASVPLLWIIPLMLYISSFIVAFSAREWKMPAVRGLYFPLGLLTLFCACFLPLASRLGITPIITVMLTLSALFVGAFLFHRRLYELRPEAENSGLFYVVLALGGALGGCFNSFVAPQIFLSAVEFPLVLSLSLLVVLLPDFLSTNVRRKTRFPYEIAALLLLLLMAAKLYISFDVHYFEGWYLAISGVLLLLVLFAALLLSDWFYQTPRRGLPAILVTGLLAGYLAETSGVSWIHAERNFFGISRVREDKEHARVIYTHGVTIHGMQSSEDQYRLTPTSYYGGPLRDIFAHLPVSVADAPIGALGLGIGTVACYAKPGQEMDFYEIDPASIHIATDPTYFTYMRDCAGKRSIIVGDARLTLTRAPDRRYGFIIMDVFTSDAIPMHLLTLEALTMYGKKLKPDGLIAFNISNQYLNLLPVIRTLSEELGWTGRYRLNIAKKDSLEVSSIWVVLAKEEKSLKLEQLSEWKPLPPETGNQYRWTDDYTNLLGVLRFRDGLAFAQ